MGKSQGTRTCIGQECKSDLHIILPEGYSGVKSIGGRVSVLLSFTYFRFTLGRNIAYKFKVN